MEHSEFESRVQQLIGRVEAWSYGESEAGAGVPVQVAGELAVLVASSPSLAVRALLRRAQDALDDGLPAEAVAAELYEARRLLREES
jgi:hypothetical protein